MNNNVQTVFDPLDDLNNNNSQEQAPPMAFTGANYGNYNNGNLFRNNNNNNNNVIDKGNASVLNVLTGEPSHSQTPNISITCILFR